MSLASYTAIIPARSGSKSIPDKNIRLLGGHPLIAYTIKAAQLSKKINRILVSTDSHEYADIALHYGAEVPFLRPTELAGDTSSDQEFMLHALTTIKNQGQIVPNFWVHLRPTTPLREPDTIDEAIKHFETHQNNCSSLRSCHKAPESPLKWFQLNGSHLKSLSSNNLSNLPKEAFDDVYIPNGYVDILKTRTITTTGSMHGNEILCYETPVVTEIDSIEEFEFAEFQLKDKAHKIQQILTAGE